MKIENPGFLALFRIFNKLGGFCLMDVLWATKTRLFDKKSRGTPSPQVQKVGRGNP